MASYTYELVEFGDNIRLGCKCCRFDKGVDLPVPKTLPHEEVAKLAKTFSTSIFKDWSKLNAILKRFEGLIHKRWLKKSTKQRKEVLLKAWPEMPTTHRPDFAGFRKVMKNTPRSRTLPSSAFLWPYINLEDLQQRHHLLLFINSRGRNLPGSFAQMDLLSAHIGHGWKWPKECDDELFGMQLYGQSSPATYGRIISMKESSTPSDSHKILQYPGTGLLILEIQDQIYRFLLSCTQLILHDIDPRQFTLGPQLPAPPTPGADSKEWPSLKAYAIESAYTAPQTMDVSRLAMMASARRASAEDHLWLLTEDPGYFVESLKEWKEHSKETMRHSCGHCWRFAAAIMVADAFTLFIFWHWIHQQLTLMKPFDQQLRRANHKTLRLDMRDEKLWLELVNVILALAEFPIAMLCAGLQASPRLRNTYFTEESMKRGVPQRKILPSSHTEAEKRVDLLFHAIADEEKRELHNLHHLVQETQYMLETDAEASALVDSWLTSIFADLAMLSELNTRIDSLDPWSCSWGATDIRHTKAAKKPMNELSELDKKLRTGLLKAFASDAWLDEARFLDILVDGRFEYPVAKRRTEENVGKMRFAEGVLDVLWAEIEYCTREESSISVLRVIKNRLIEPRTKHRTEEWAPPLIAPPPRAAALTEVSTNIQRFGEGSNATEVVTPAKEKNKIKTRGTPTALQDRLAASVIPTPTPTAEHEPSSTVTIKVPKRAYKVLAALFPPPGAAAHQRAEVAWDELLQAFDTIGFQPMKLYGSVWVFTPRAGEECKVNAKRSIQFHEPKEVRRGQKIPTQMVRTFGRRMKHAYGWMDGMFVCE